MNNVEHYLQCTMRQGDLRDVAWIPEDCAREGAVVSWGDGDGVWTITSVGTLRQPWSAVNERSRDWKSQRKASDI